ncbi:FAD-dependent oxidoreductase [Thiohalorhabdus methylotrophus]|uniref:Dihydrolipoamide acetyltransferase component of pyruvate dehydrogenase complex n=1 Tax=Thiohalorhabdus methylotrophus TaxID=3242694 RepID=A0ABV4TW95_9GAMM
MASSYTIKMPQLSDTMTEGVLVEWEKQPGEHVARGDVVAQVETDKAIMDVEVFREGYLSGPIAPVDATVPVGDALGYLVESEDEVVHEEAEGGAPAAKPEAAPAPEEQPAAPQQPATEQPAAEAPQQAGGPQAPAPRPKGKKATPYSRVLARLLSVDLERLVGTGPDGEITAKDVEAAAPAGAAAGGEPASGAVAPRRSIPGHERDMTSLERAVAHNMQDALTMPLFRVSMHAHPERLQQAAKSMGISFTILLARACGEAIKKHPAMNNAYQFGDKVVERSNVDVGIAVEADKGGLVVPVLRDVNNRELSDLASGWKDLVSRARGRRLTPAEYEHPTFMLSNLGMFGVEHFDAIPVPGASGILAVGAVTEQGMGLTLSCDHRVINGADAARYLGDLKTLIENPDSWLEGGFPLIPEGDWDVEVAVIGGGTGGEDAARELAENGHSVALINDDELPGGECLWRGCIPSKAWRASANRLRDRAGDSQLGVRGTDQGTLDWNALETHRKGVMQSRGEMAYKADKGLKIDYRQGRARLTGDHSLAYTDADGNEQQLTFGAAIVATGAPPFVPPIPGADSEGVETSNSIWHLPEPPKRLAVIGCGAIGLEMAQIFRDFGAEVTTFEIADRVLPEVEGEVAKSLTQILEGEDRLALNLGAKVDKIDGAVGDMTVHYTDADGKQGTVQVDRVLVATGKRPNFDGFGLDAAGVDTETGFIKVDDRCRTSVPHIFAVGDVVPGLMLAHTAATQGRVAAANLLGERARYDQALDCGVIFTRPEAAFAGLTEEQAKEAGYDPVAAKTLVKIDAMAMIEGEEEGLIKMVVDKTTHRILGVHILADHADNLIGEAVMMVSGRLTVDQVAEAIHPHPTQTEMFGDLARRLLSRLKRAARKAKA